MSDLFADVFAILMICDGFFVRHAPWVKRKLTKKWDTICYLKTIFLNIASSLDPYMTHMWLPAFLLWLCSNLQWLVLGEFVKKTFTKKNIVASRNKPMIKIIYFWENHLMKCRVFAVCEKTSHILFTLLIIIHFASLMWHIISVIFPLFPWNKTKNDNKTNE